MSPQELASFLTQEVHLPAWRLLAIMGLALYFMVGIWIQTLKNERLLKQVSELKAIAAFSEPRRQKGGAKFTQANISWGDPL